MATIGDPFIAAENVAETTPAQPPEEVATRAKSTKSKKATTAKVKKAAAPKKRGSSAHPTYFEMIKEGIVSLKERTGSSQYAITKFIEDKQKNLPPNFRKVLLVQLKRLVAADKLVKVKASYKLPPARPKPAAASAPAKKKPAPATKPKTVAKPKAKAAASKAKPKAKAAAVSTKAQPKAAAAPKTKAVDATKPVAKVAKTSKITSPAKKAPVKSVKPKTVKSPAKKAAAKKGKK